MEYQMNKFSLSIAAMFCMTCASFAVDLVKDGKPVAEIVLAESAEPSVKTAANELQINLEKMSGAKLAIVTNVSPDVKNQVYERFPMRKNISPNSRI